MAICFLTGEYQCDQEDVDNPADGLHVRAHACLYMHPSGHGQHYQWLPRQSMALEPISETQRHLVLWTIHSL
jgi:hypothetical protein